MDAAEVVVVDAEPAIAGALAVALGERLPTMTVAVATAPNGNGDVCVLTWPGSDVSARTVVLLARAATPGDARDASAAGPGALVSRGEPFDLVADAVRLVAGGATFVSPAAASLVDAAAPPTAFTPAETRLIEELARRPDTRSRVARRLGVSTSTLDNHIGAVKRKVLAELVTSGNAPSDGYLSMEALIGWATRHYNNQKT
ncbi:MAG TPA: hypothetical protein VNB24_05170 [Acidimicrobiales bacterium]|nr:hypothetical protein [Acidimicrobiales bacterium]